MTIALIVVLATTVGLVLWLLVCVAQLRYRIDELDWQVQAHHYALDLPRTDVEDRS